MSDDDDWGIGTVNKQPEPATTAKVQKTSGRGRGRGQEQQIQKQKEPSQNSEQWITKPKEETNPNKSSQKQQRGTRKSPTHHQQAIVNSVSVESNISDIIHPNATELLPQDQDSSWMIGDAVQQKKKEQNPKTTEDGRSGRRGNRGGSKDKQQKDDGRQINQQNQAEEPRRGNRGNRDTREGGYRGGEGGDRGQGGFRGRGRGRGGFNGSSGYNRDYNNNREGDGNRPYNNRNYNNDGNQREGGNFRRNREDGDNREGGNFRRNREEGNNFNNRDNQGGRGNRGDRFNNNQNRQREPIQQKKVQIVEKVIQKLVPATRRRAWPSCQIFILGKKLSITLRKVQLFNAKLLVIPYRSLKFDYYPGNFVNSCSIDYRAKIKLKQTELEKGGSVYFQKAKDLQKYQGVAFLRIDEAQKDQSLETGIKFLMKNIQNLQTDNPLDSIVFPISKQLCEPEKVINIFAHLLQTQKKVNEVHITTIDPTYFQKCMTDFQRFVMRLVDENQLCLE